MGCGRLAMMRVRPHALLLSLAAALTLSACAPSQANPGAASPQAATTNTSSTAPESESQPGSTVGASLPVPVCPNTLPGGPANLPDGATPGPADRLLPETPVGRAVLCSYDGSNMEPDMAVGGDAPGGWPLSGQAELTGGLAELAADLRWAPPAIESDHLCTAVGGPQTTFLLGLTLADSTESWLSGAKDPNTCTKTTNGSFVSKFNNGDQFTVSMTAGTWAPDPRPPRAGCPVGGRWGQQDRMVPDRVIGVAICQDSAANPAITEMTSGYEHLVDLLNSQPANTSQQQKCYEDQLQTAGQGLPLAFVTLVFRYGEGPPVVVTVWAGCTQPIDNGNLEATDASQVLPEVVALLESAGASIVTPTGTSTSF